MEDPETPTNEISFRNRSGNIAQLAKALATAQKNFAPIPKDREVTVYTDKGSYKFKYATLDAIRSATMPALSEQGLAVVQGMSPDNKALETTLYHSSGEWLCNTTPMFVSGRRGKDGQVFAPSNQEFGSAQTYARRYGISALLCITADEDDDANHADGNHVEQHKPGAAGSAGAGGQFRPAKRTGWAAEAERDGLIDETRPKGKLPDKKAGNGREATPTEARAAKITSATNKRVEVLKSKSVWTRAELDQFWTDNGEWIDWMADPTNKALEEYERFTAAYEDAGETVRPVELA